MYQEASKNKTYDSELFIKKSVKLTIWPQKRKENFFSPMNLDPLPQKIYFSKFFFQKILFIRLRIYIYTN